MRNIEKITKCRYYNGEVVCPKIIFEEGNGLFWDYESRWCTDDSFRDLEGFMMKDYLNAGLEEFHTNDNVPITLKAVLFNRFMHWNYDDDRQHSGFKKWYFQYYLNQNHEIQNRDYESR